MVIRLLLFVGGQNSDESFFFPFPKLAEIVTETPGMSNNCAQ